MTGRQKTLVEFLKKYYPNETVKVFEDDDPNKKIIFEGSPAELEKFWESKAK